MGVKLSFVYLTCQVFILQVPSLPQHTDCIINLGWEHSCLMVGYNHVLWKTFIYSCHKSHFTMIVLMFQGKTT